MKMIIDILKSKLHINHDNNEEAKQIKTLTIQKLIATKHPRFMSMKKRRRYLYQQKQSY